MNAHVRGIDGLLKEPVILKLGAVTVEIKPYRGIDGFKHHELRIEDHGSHKKTYWDPHFEDNLPVLRRLFREFAPILAEHLYKKAGGDPFGYDEYYNSLGAGVQTKIQEALDMYVDRITQTEIALRS